MSLSLNLNNQKLSSKIHFCIIKTKSYFNIFNTKDCIEQIMFLNCSTPNLFKHLVRTKTKNLQRQAFLGTSVGAIWRLYVRGSVSYC